MKYGTSLVVYPKAADAADYSDRWPLMFIIIMFQDQLRFHAHFRTQFKMIDFRNKSLDDF